MDPKRYSSFSRPQYIANAARKLLLGLGFGGLSSRSDGSAQGEFLVLDELQINADARRNLSAFRALDSITMV